MKKLVALFLVVSASLRCQTGLNFTVTNASWSYSITCFTPQLTLTASSDHTAAPVSYYWQGPGVSITATNVVINNPGNYTVHATAGSLNSVQVIAIGINTTIPVSIINPTLITVTGTQAITMTVTTTTPIVNLTQFLYTPTGFTNVTSVPVAEYTLGSIGNYTHCTQDDINGCMSCQEIIVTYYDGIFGSKNTENSILIYPNPAQDELQIQFANDTENESKKILVYDNLGRMIREEDIVFESRKAVMQLQDLPNGVYFFEFKNSNNEVISKRFVITR